jgi:hypothetical protein
MRLKPIATAGAEHVPQRHADTGTHNKQPQDWSSFHLHCKILQQTEPFTSTMTCFFSVQTATYLLNLLSLRLLCFWTLTTVLILFRFCFSLQVELPSLA